MPTIVTYPVDLTGTNPNNLVIGEEVDLAALSTLLIVPAHGTFFEQGLIVRDFYTQQPLVKQVDYVVAQLDPTATIRAGGKACYQLIIVKNESINKITLQYQCVGGEYSLSVEAIAEFIAMLENDNRPITWGMLIGTPSVFPPAPHTTNAYDTFGFSDLIFAIGRLGDKIAGGDANALEAVYNYIDIAVGGGSSNVAKLAEAIAGTANNKFMTPLRTKQVLTLALQDLTALASNDIFEYDISADPASWGYIRHKTNDLCICWGSGIAVAADEQYRVNFRRRFDTTPLLIPGDSTFTADVTPTGGQWGEVLSRVPEHAITADGFYVVGNRLNGTGADRSRVRYVAIGKSSSSQPLSVSGGYAATIPPVASVVQQPIWSGNALGEAIITGGETKYIGLAFPSDVLGGGVMISGAIGNSTSSFYYTPYPDNFVTGDYEIKASAAIADANYPGNFTYVGTPLDSWIDLTALKAKVIGDPTKGYLWTVTDQFAGTMVVTVTIRHKTTLTILANRVFELKQTTDIAAIGPMSPSANVTATYFVTDAGTHPLSLDLTTTGITVISQSGTDSYTFARPVNDLANYECRTVMTASTPNGHVISGSSEDNNTWISAELADPFLMTISGNMLTVSNVNVMAFQLRHKKDRYKSITFNLFLNKTGNGTLPVWNGNFNSMAWGSNANCYLQVFLNAPNGSGYVYSNAGGSGDHGYFTYSFGKTGWDDTNYEAKVVQTVFHESGPNTFSLTYVGVTLGTYQPLTSVWRWNAADTTSAGATAGYITVRVYIRHKTTLQESYQDLTMDLRGAGYNPGGGVMD